MEDTLTQFMQMSMANQRSNEAAIKNLENQVGQLAKQIAKQQSGPSFSANTQPNPKEHCKAVVTRSGGGGWENVVENDSENVVEEEIVEEEKIEEEVVEKYERGVEKNNVVDREEKHFERVVVENEMYKEELRERRNRSRKGKDKMNTIPTQNMPYPHVPT